MYPPPPFGAPPQPYIQPNPYQAASPQIPMCAHGDACWRKDCVFTHPPAVQKAPNVCLAFLTSTCRFGDKCRHSHVVTPEEAARLRAAFADTPCKHGSSCASQHCMFKHPETTPQSSDGAHNPYDQ